MSINQSIFDDLEISTEGFIDPDHFKNFAQTVMIAAAKLEKILDTNTTVADVEKEAVKKAVNHKVPTELDDMITTLYESGENIELSELYLLKEAVRALANDLENSFHEKAKETAAEDSATLSNKKLAHLQHKRLREVWDNYRAFIKSFYQVEFPAIKSKPGNYTASLTHTYRYSFPDGNYYYNHRAAARKLGIFYEGIPFMDIMEYCEKHPEEVEVKKVALK